MARISVRKSKGRKGWWVVVVNGRPIKRYSSKMIAKKKAMALKNKSKKKGKKKR